VRQLQQRSRQRNEETLSDSDILEASNSTGTQVVYRVSNVNLVDRSSAHELEASTARKPAPVLLMLMVSTFLTVAPVQANVA
jgi:hypothetical protein